MAKREYRDASYQRTLAAYKAAVPHLRCGICGEQISRVDDVSVDHVQPVSSFPTGTATYVVNEPGNLRPTHLRCNKRRGNRTWRRTRKGDPTPQAGQARQTDPRYT